MFSVRWQQQPYKDGRQQWELVVIESSRGRVAANVWENASGRATWHTWDRDGQGGEKRRADRVGRSDNQKQEWAGQQTARWR